MHGEFGDGPDGRTVHSYPTIRELAERFGVSRTTVQRFAQRHNCLARRAGGADAPSPPASAMRDPERMLPTIREIFVTWIGAVQRGEIVITSAGEIEKMMRIAADLDAEAQMRALIPAGIPTLDELQDLHERAMREYVGTTPGERGELPVGLDAVIAPGEASVDGQEPSEASAADAC